MPGIESMGELKNFVINPSTADKENNNIVVNSYTSDGNVLLVKPGFITAEGHSGLFGVSGYF